MSLLWGHQKAGCWLCYRQGFLVLRKNQKLFKYMNILHHFSLLLNIKFWFLAMQWFWGTNLVINRHDASTVVFLLYFVLWNLKVKRATTYVLCGWPVLSVRFCPQMPSHHEKWTLSKHKKKNRFLKKIQMSFVFGQHEYPNWLISCA